MNAEERLLENGYGDIHVFPDGRYATALIGVSDDGRAVYDYELMIEWLMKEEGWSYEDSVLWISENTLPALSVQGEDTPVVINRLIDVTISVD
jgi:hypothetical protein